MPVQKGSCECVYYAIPSVLLAVSNDWTVSANILRRLRMIYVPLQQLSLPDMRAEGSITHYGHFVPKHMQSEGRA